MAMDGPNEGNDRATETERILTTEAEKFLTVLPQSGRLLSLDLGTKTIGLAMSDPARTIAAPLLTIKRARFKNDAARLLEIEAQNLIVGYVLGLPTNMNGTEGPRVQATRAFARNLAALTALPILLWDERLTTAAAERTLLEADTSRRRRAEVIDKVAATLILQGALERLRALERASASTP